MVKNTAVRGALLAVVALTLAGCSADIPAETASAAAQGAVHQLEGAQGDVVALGEDLTIVIPAGSTAEPVVSKVPGSQYVMYRMPEADAEGFPVVQISWGRSDVGSTEGAWTHQTTMTANSAVSHYESSSVKWAGADEAVAATWTEDIVRDSGTITTDAAALWVDLPDGTKAVVMVFTRQGTLHSSSAFTTLQTLTLR